MKILKIRIKGFRNINDIEINFNNIVGLISLNNYGKSNLLGSINFALDFIKVPSGYKKRLMSWKKGIPLNKSMDTENFSADFDLITTFQGKKTFVNYGFEFKWHTNDDSGSVIKSEWLKYKFDERGQKYNTLISRSDSGANYKTSESGRCSNKINVQEDDLIVNKLNAYDNLYYFEIIQKLHRMNFYIERHLDATSSYEFNPFIKKGCTEFDLENISNIPRLVYYLREKYPDKYSLLVNTFIQLFPQILDMKVRQISVKDFYEDLTVGEEDPYIVSDSDYKIYVRDKYLNQPISFELMSDGAKRVFLMLVYALCADLNGFSIFAIEEPENSIHPSLLQDYLRIITQLLGDCSLIITSHSPYIIKYLSPSDIYVGMPTKTGIAQFYKIQSSMVKKLISDANSLDVSTGEYLFDLLSGNDDDVVQLYDYMEK